MRSSAFLKSIVVISWGALALPALSAPLDRIQDGITFAVQGGFFQSGYFGIDINPATPTTPLISEELADGTKHTRFRIESDLYQLGKGDASDWVAWPETGGAVQPGFLDTYLTTQGTSYLEFDWFFVSSCHGTCNDHHVSFKLDNQQGDLFLTALPQDYSFQYDSGFGSIIHRSYAVTDPSDISTVQTSFTIAVPEAQTSAMGLGGMLVIGLLASYRRRQRAAMGST